MADSCSQTVDGEAVGGDCVKEQMTASQVQGDEMVECKDKEGSQREGVVDVHAANKQTSQTSTHVEQQNETLPFQRIPLENVAPRDEGGPGAGQSSDVACEVQAERQDSEMTTSPSSVNSLLEETTPHSETTLNVSGENGISMDELLSSTKSTADCDYASDQGLSMSDEIEMAQAAAPEPELAVPSYYLVKWITWKEKKTPIITQSENGPCPLIAIMNILFLRWKVILPAQTEVVTIEELMAHLGECVLSIKPREKVEGMELNFQQNMSDAMAVLPKLSTGLDVNVRFTGVTDFEYTPECIVFDLLDIPLYHGWLVDPQSPEMVAAVGKLSYNQLVEKIIEYKHSTDCVRVSEGLTAEQFLESTATQLSYHGLCELNTTAKEGELSVFFRNNHFSTMIKHKGYLYLLVTDQGFLQEDGVVWESLHNVEGDGNFCDSDFRLCHPAQKPTTTTTAAAAAAAAASQPTAQEQQLQIDQDYLVAMSLQQGQAEAPGPLSDLELARQLQQEEYQQPQQRPHASSEQMRSQAAPHHGGRRRAGEKKEDSDCSIL